MRVLEYQFYIEKRDKFWRFKNYAHQYGSTIAYQEIRVLEYHTRRYRCWSINFILKKGIHFVGSGIVRVSMLIQLHSKFRGYVHWSINFILKKGINFVVSGIVRINRPVQLHTSRYVYWSIIPGDTGAGVPILCWKRYKFCRLRNCARQYVGTISSRRVQMQLHKPQM